MTYEEMQALAKRIAERVGGELLDFEPGDSPVIMCDDDVVGETIVLTVSLP